MSCKIFTGGGGISDQEILLLVVLPVTGNVEVVILITFVKT